MFRGSSEDRRMDVVGLLLVSLVRDFFDKGNDSSFGYVRGCEFRTTEGFVRSTTTRQRTSVKVSKSAPAGISSSSSIYGKKNENYFWFSFPVFGLP